MRWRMTFRNRYSQHYRILHNLAQGPIRMEAVLAYQMEKMYSWEMKNFGYVTQPTRDMRHYWLQRLLERQLKEFNYEQGSEGTEEGRGGQRPSVHTSEDRPHASGA